MSHVWLSTLSRLATIVLLLVVLSIVSPAFLSVQNLVNIVRQASLLFLLASGLTIVILTAGIDLSIGSVLALSGSVAANFIQQGWIWAGGLIGLAIGAGCGLLNGVMVALIGLPAFIATYGMLWIAQGFAQVFMKGEIISGFPTDFRFLGAGYVFRIPVPILVMAAVLAAVVFALAGRIRPPRVRPRGEPGGGAALRDQYPGKPPAGLLSGRADLGVRRAGLCLANQCCGVHHRRAAALARSRSCLHWRHIPLRRRGGIEGPWSGL
jgi:ABC-type xylose transport system permease subunit